MTLLSHLSRGKWGKWTTGVSGPKFVFVLVVQQYFQIGILIIGLHNFSSTVDVGTLFHMHQPADKFSGSLFYTMSLAINFNYRPF